MGGEKAEEFGTVKVRVWDEGSRGSIIVKDGSFVCMCWEGSRGNQKVEVAVEQGDQQKKQCAGGGQKRQGGGLNELLLSKS